MSKTVIKITNLVKEYKMYSRKKDKLLEAMFPNIVKGKHGTFRATNNLDLEIKEGEVVGILGKNGSGKSTLLKMITGVVFPTSGNIEINGISNISEQELLTQLNQYGLKIGNAKRKIDSKQIVSDIRLIRNDSAWMGITISGTNAIVEIVEATEKPEIIDDKEFCNIVSDKDGIITKINVQNGTAIAKRGDLVKKGDLLVEGKIQGKYTEAIYVNS